MASNLLLYPPTNLSAIYPLNDGLQTNSKEILIKKEQYLNQKIRALIFEKFNKPKKIKYIRCHIHESSDAWLRFK